VTHNRNAALPGKSTLFLYYWLPLILYCLALFAQSSFPSPDSLPQWSGSDKLLHVSAYAVMAILFHRAYRTSKPEKGLRHVAWISILFTSCYGISDEVHQYFVPSRSADLWDVVADVVGSVFGVLVFQYITRIRLRRRKVTKI